MKNDAAFPVVASNENHFAEIEVRATGLTKREYFAAMAMQGLLASFNDVEFMAKNTLALKSVEYADAVLTELEK